MKTLLSSMLKHKILKAPTFLFNWETINHLANPQKRDITDVHNNYYPNSLVCKFALENTLYTR
jgi:hypothetical protein